MSREHWNGGKGSKPRPFNIPKEKWDKNHSQVFGEKKLLYYNKDCGCYRCMAMKFDPNTKLPLTMNTFIVCPDCGNKRCPKSTDHTLVCTNSNDPGQEGSRYA
jgi:hypothetical protein